MTKLILLRGPAGCGKTSFAKKLSKKLNSNYYSIDNLLNQKKLDVIINGKIPLQNFLKVNKTIISKGMFQEYLIIEGNFYYKEQILDLIKHFNEYFIFTLKTSLDMCIKRDKLRKNSLGSKAIGEVYDLNFNFGEEIDVSTENIDVLVEDLISNF